MIQILKIRQPSTIIVLVIAGCNYKYIKVCYAFTKLSKKTLRKTVKPVYCSLCNKKLSLQQDPDAAALCGKTQRKWRGETIDTNREEQKVLEGIMLLLNRTRWYNPSPSRWHLRRHCSTKNLHAGWSNTWWRHFHVQNRSEAIPNSYCCTAIMIIYMLDPC